MKEPLSFEQISRWAGNDPTRHEMLGLYADLKKDRDEPHAAFITVLFIIGMSIAVGVVAWRMFFVAG